MRKIASLWRSTFDVREGERLRTLFMSLYLFLVLYVHYILKPISRGLFVGEYKIDKLPFLYILIAVAGGLLMSVYTKVALRTSLRASVTWTMSLAVLSIVVFWWLVQDPPAWALYAFNIWASLFGAVVVAQGYVVAANVFSSREAKRVYGFLGLGAAAGGLAGAAFTAGLIKQLGYRPFLLICALLVGLAYLTFRLAITRPGVSLTGAKAAESEESRSKVADLFVAIGRNRHLRMITVIITFVFIVDQLVDFQLSAVAKSVYESDRDISRFLALVGLFQNLVTFVLQFLLTGALISWLGVGGTLRLMPASITIASLGSIFWPSVITAVFTRLTEAASRYSFNRTGMELLYLPLPAELRNRTKAFMDVFMDRAARGIAGILLWSIMKLGLTPTADYSVSDLRAIPLIVIGFTVAWLILSKKVQNEYVRTIRNRLDARRLELQSARIAVTDPAMIGFLEQTARSANPRQACYALSLLGDAPGYVPDPLLNDLVRSPLAEVRAGCFELARKRWCPGLLEPGLLEVRSGAAGAVEAATRYVLTVVPKPLELARTFLEAENPFVAESTVRAMPELSDTASDLITREWLSEKAADPNPERRRLAAVAIAVRGDSGTEALHRLLQDPAPRVAAAACLAAGKLGNRAYLQAIVNKLADPRVRGAAIEALAAYGVRSCGTLGDLLEDPSVPPAVRRQVPRVLRSIPEQHSVDVLLRSINDPNLFVRLAVVKALNRLRETAPALDFGAAPVARQILEEARRCYELSAALQPLRGREDRRTATGLLAATLEERLKQALERLFRLLGLRYPPKEVYAAYLAVQRRRGDRFVAALDFLDNVLDREFRNVLLPLLEDAAHLAEKGRQVFGVEARTPEEVIGGLIQSGDPWQVACAIAAAAEQKLRGLVPEITKAAAGGGAEVNEVARAACLALA